MSRLLTPADVDNQIQNFVQNRGWKNSLVNGSIPQSVVHTDALANPATLPSNQNSTDGDEVYYTADASNGVTWHLRYNANSASSKKWECVGGPPMVAEVDTDETTASVTYGVLTTSGPQIVVPLAGDYEVEVGFNGYITAAATQSLLMSYSVGVTGAVDSDAANFDPAAINAACSVSRSRRKNDVVSGGQGILANYKSPVGGTVHFRYRWMKVTPIRVSA